MTPVLIESTPKTPCVSLNPENGTFEIKGMSCAEYALDFYRPIFDWLDEYAENPRHNTIVNIQLKYFNTSSAKCILQFFERIAKIQNLGFVVEINWSYNKYDEQMLADGENYSEILGIPFKMQEMD